MNDRECPGPTLERCARVLGVKVEQLRLGWLEREPMG